MMNIMDDQKQLENRTIVGIKILNKDGIMLFFDDESQVYIDMGSEGIKYICKDTKGIRP